MANVDGKWDCTVRTPLGDQRFTLTVESSGDTFTGSADGSIGSMAIPDGTVSGDTLGWSMAVTKPMPLTLTANAAVSGDQLSGDVRAGGFGSFPISGTRV